MSVTPTVAASRPPQQHPPMDPTAALIESSLKFGLGCGSIGFLFGGTAGILKNATPFLFASASGLQSFALGTTFWGVRSGVLQAWNPEQQTPANFIKASTFSGGVTGGAVALVVRGRRNVIPGTIMFALFGFLGQVVANRYSAEPREKTTAATSTEPFWKRMADKKWSPVTVMSDEEYTKFLREKMLKLDVEIALIDDKVEALRREQQQSESSQLSGGNSTKP